MLTGQRYRSEQVTTPEGAADRPPIVYRDGFGFRVRQEIVAGQTSKHVAEVPLLRRLGFRALLGLGAVALVAGVVFVIAATGDGSSSAVDVPPTAGSSGAAPNTVPETSAPASAGSMYVETPAPVKLSRSRQQPRLTVLEAPRLRRMSTRETLRARAVQIAAQTQHFSLVMGTLNVLGSQHTTRPGGYGPGVDRAAREASLIEALHLDVVGLQEVQRDQLGVFETHLPGYAVFPQLTQSSQGYRLQIAYRTDRFTAMDSGQMSYLFSHMWIPLPWILLKDNATGGELYVIDAHNSPNGQQVDRVTSSTIEAKLIEQLEAEHPVFLVGDLNEQGPVYCRLAAGTGLTASDGATYDAAGCHVPGGFNPIDWLMGSPGVAWSDDHVDPVTKQQGMSDHNLVYATAAVTDPPPRAVTQP